MALAVLAVGSTFFSLTRVQSGATPNCGVVNESVGFCANGTRVCDLRECNGLCGTNGTTCGISNAHSCADVPCNGGVCDVQVLGNTSFSGTCLVAPGLNNTAEHVCDLGGCSRFCRTLGEICATTDFNLCSLGVCVEPKDPGRLICEIQPPSPSVPACDDANLCTLDSCNPGANVGTGGCQHKRLEDCTDDDGDGVDTDVENEVPSAPGSSFQPMGDGNGDGILDSLQHNITSLPTATGRGFITLLSSCDQNLNVTAFTEEDLGTDPLFRYLFGLVGFETCNGGVDCTGNCSASDIEMIFHNSTGFQGSVLRKYGPLVPDDVRRIHFYPFNVTFVGNKADYQVVDGQRGDAFGVDGMIVDPAGPAIQTAQPAPALGTRGLVAIALAFLGLELVLRRWRRRSA